jgi:hypothetical protein
MRLLNLDDSGRLGLTGPINRDVPEYAILSHTWGPDGEEVAYEDMVNGSGKDKPGYTKLRFAQSKYSVAAYDTHGLKLAALYRSTTVDNAP